MLIKFNKFFVSIITVGIIVLMNASNAFGHIGVPIHPLVFPVYGNSNYRDTFGAPRSGGRTHKGTDIMGFKGQRLLAAAPGTVTWMSYGSSGGYMLKITDTYGNSYYYMHLNNDHQGTDDGKGGVATAYPQGIKEGVTVKAGQVVGYMGDSGNAEYTSPHLHFELHPAGKDAICSYNSLIVARRETAPRDTFNFSNPTIIKINPNPFSPDNNGFIDQTSFNFTLSRDAYVTIRIMSYKEEVSRLVTNRLFYGGKQNSVSWNGYGKYGKFLPNGTYYYEIIANNGLVKSSIGLVTVKSGLLPSGISSPSIYSLSTSTNPFYPKNSSLKKMMSYSLSTDSIVKITINSYKGPVKTIISSKFRKAGAQKALYNDVSDAGQTLPAGNYRLYVTATNSKGSSVASKVLPIR